MPNNQNNLSKKIFGSMDCLAFDALLAYSENRLSPKEHLRVERHLVDCDFCYKVIGGLKQVRSEDELDRLTKKINRDIAKRFSAPTSKSWLKYAAAAAVLVIGLGVGSILYTVKQPSLAEQLFIEYFEPFPNIVPLVRGEEPKELMKQAMQAYDLKMYARVAEILRSVVADDPTNMMAHFYLGVALLTLDEPQTAISHFDKVVAEDDDKFLDYAQWYLALAYLKQNKPVRTKKILEKFTTPDTNYALRGEQLLRALD